MGNLLRGDVNFHRAPVLHAKEMAATSALEILASSDMVTLENELSLGDELTCSIDAFSAPNASILHVNSSPRPNPFSRVTISDEANTSKALHISDLASACEASDGELFRMSDESEHLTVKTEDLVARSEATLLTPEFNVISFQEPEIATSELNVVHSEEVIVPNLFDPKEDNQDFKNEFTDERNLSSSEDSPSITVDNAVEIGQNIPSSSDYGNLHVFSDAIDVHSGSGIVFDPSKYEEIKPASKEMIFSAKSFGGSASSDSFLQGKVPLLWKSSTSALDFSPVNSVNKECFDQEKFSSLVQSTSQNQSDHDDGIKNSDIGLSRMQIHVTDQFDHDNSDSNSFEGSKEMKMEFLSDNGESESEAATVGLTKKHDGFESVEITHSNCDANNAHFVSDYQNIHIESITESRSYVSEGHQESVTLKSLSFDSYFTEGEAPSDPSLMDAHPNNTVEFAADTEEESSSLKSPSFDSYFDEDMASSTIDSKKSTGDKSSRTSSAVGSNFVDVPSAHEFLEKNGWPGGLRESFLLDIARCPLRYMILDDSKSMATTDGKCRIGDKIVKCSRWQELLDAVNFHAELSYQANLVTEFRFLNGSGPIVIDKTDGGRLELEQLRNLYDNAPSGGTPLCSHISEVVRQITDIKDQLHSRGHRVTLVVMTDGIPNDGDILSAMMPLRQLPVLIVVRLCTNDFRVVKYWNKIDRELEMENITILDDICGEADEIYSVNPWLTYGEPLHRAREFGAIELGHLDKTPLTKLELIQALTEM